MNQVLVHDSPAPPRRTRTAIVAGVLAVAIVAVVLVVADLVRAPAVVDRITVVNPTDELISVRVRGAGDPSWSSVVLVEPGRRAVARDVIDQGDRWIFQFRFANRDRGEVRISRADLERAGWRLTVPSATGPGAVTP